MTERRGIAHVWSTTESLFDIQDTVDLFAHSCYTPAALHRISPTVISQHIRSSFVGRLGTLRSLHCLQPARDFVVFARGILRRPVVSCVAFASVLEVECSFDSFCIEASCVSNLCRLEYGY